MPPTAVRRRHLLLLGLTLSLGALLAACGARPAATATLTVLSSATPTRTPPPSATETARPTSTASATRRSSATLTATPTRRPSSTAQPSTTPLAPIATLLSVPPAGPNAYRLKPWDPVDVPAWLALLNNYTDLESYVSCCGYYNVYQGVDAAAGLLAREALLRDPHSPLDDELRWRIAWAAAMTGDASQDAWIIEALAAELNAAPLPQTHLVPVALSHGFFVNLDLPAPNLFGDGAAASVIQLTVRPGESNGLILALRPLASGSVQLVKLASHWLPNLSASDTVQVVGDQNLDGLPEVLVTLGFYTRYFCEVRLFVFQWQADHFVDWGRSPTQPAGLTSDACHSEAWRVGPSDADGFAVLQVRRAAQRYADVSYFHNYRWTPDGYADDGVALDEPPPAADSWTTGVLAPFWETGDYARISTWLEDNLNAWPQRRDKLELGLSYRDFLRLQLALAAAYQGRTEEARAQLQALITQPANPTRSVVPAAARAYLDHYTGEGDLYRACLAAQASVQASRLAYSDAPYLLFFPEDYVEFQGYYDGRDDLAVCSPHVALLYLARAAPHGSLAEFQTYLRAAGAEIGVSLTRDLDQDGQDDWVLPVKVNETYAPWEVWVVLAGRPTPRIFSISAFPSSFSLDRPGLTLDAAPVVTSLDLSGVSRPVLVVDGADDLLFVHVATIADRPQVVQLGPVISYAQHGRYTFRLEPEAAELHVDTHSYACPACTSIYAWGAQQQRFVLQGVIGRPATASSRLSEAESLLFDQRNAHAARSRYGAALALTKDDEYPAPRILYGLAVAAELDGDPATAARVFWQLWQQHPQSAYALLASQRLEPAP